MSTPTTRKQLKPFGADKTHALRMKQQALNTLTRQECFEKGYITVKDLDDEELRYGRCRDQHGQIPRTEGKTELIPIDMYDEMVAEHELRFKQKLRQNLDDMLDVMVSVAKDDTVEPRDRFEAAKYLFERTAGKTAEVVNVNVKSAPYEELLNTVTGVGAISRAEHRRISEEQGHSAGVIDVEYAEVEDDAPPQDVQDSSEVPTEPPVVPVRPLRPDEQDAEPQPPTFVGEEPIPGENEPYYEYVDVPVGPDAVVRTNNNRKPTPEPTDADPYSQSYGSKRTESNNYADQARAAQDLAQRRKEAKGKITQAKKQRRIDRATGADAITDDITGATLDVDGKLHFE